MEWSFFTLLLVMCVSVCFSPEEDEAEGFWKTGAVEAERWRLSPTSLAFNLVLHKYSHITIKIEERRITAGRMSTLRP